MRPPSLSWQCHQLILHRPITPRSFKLLMSTFISFCEHTHHHAYNNFTSLDQIIRRIRDFIPTTRSINFLLFPEASSDNVFESALGICQQPRPRSYHPIESSACKSEHDSFIQINITISVCHYQNNTSI